MKSGMKKMSAIQFKQALCMELLRCESIVKDTLPSIIKVWAMQGLRMLAQPYAKAIKAHFNTYG